MLRTFSGKKPDRPPTPEDSVEATVRVHEVRYAALQQRAWAVVAVAGDEASARALGPATSERGRVRRRPRVFAAAATFEAPRDSDVTVTILSGAGEREDAVTVGAVRFSTADGRDAWRPPTTGGRAMCAACVRDVAAADPARLGPRRTRRGVATRERGQAGRQRATSPGPGSAPRRAEAYAAAAGTLESYATVGLRRPRSRRSATRRCGARSRRRRRAQAAHGRRPHRRAARGHAPRGPDRARRDDPHRRRASCDPSSTTRPALSRALAGRPDLSGVGARLRSGAHKAPRARRRCLRRARRPRCSGGRPRATSARPRPRSRRRTTPTRCSRRACGTTARRDRRRRPTRSRGRRSAPTATATPTATTRSRDGGSRARTASTASSRGQRLISRRLGVARWRPGE